MMSIPFVPIVPHTTVKKKTILYSDTVLPVKSAEILEEVKNILVTGRVKDDDCISLYEIAELMKIKYYQYEKMKKTYEAQLEYMINNKYRNTKIIVHNFDYDKNELRIAFKYFEKYNVIRFSKKNKDLFITESETNKGEDILAILGDRLTNLYDEFINYKDFMKQSKFGFKSVNSNFLIDVSSNRVSITVRSQSNRKDFELSFHSYTDEYDYDCNSYNVISAFQGKEDEIFKRIFVKISDCPEWSQPILYEIRQDQLEEEKRKEEEIQYQETKKQKKLESPRKIFSFLKKK